MESKIGVKELLAPIDFDGELVPPVVMPVLYLKGSFYDMGVQYGIGAKEMIRRNAAVTVSDAVIATGSIEAAAEKLQIYYDITAEKAPELVEMWNGIAQGAGITLAQAAMVNCQLPMMAGPANCSVLAAWGSATKDSKLVTACNVDTVTSGGYFGVVLVMYPEKGNSLITTVNLAGKLCGGVTLNDKGLSMCITGGQAARPEDHKAGYDPIGSMIYTLLRSDTIKEAVDVYLDLHVFSAGTVTLTQEQSAVIIEHTCKEDVVRYPGNHGEKDYIHTTNHFLSEALQPAHFTNPPVRHSNARYDGEDVLLRQKLGELDFESLLEILSCNDYWDGEKWHKNTWDENRNVEELGLSTPNMRSIGYKTNSTVAALPEEGVLYVRQGSKDLACSLVPGSLNQHCRITLRPDASKSVLEAEQEAAARLWESARTISLCGANENVRFISDAKEKFWMGINYRAKAMTAEDETGALEAYGKAATYFMESQALSYAACSSELIP